MGIIFMIILFEFAETGFHAPTGKSKALLILVFLSKIYLGVWMMLQSRDSLYPQIKKLAENKRNNNTDEENNVEKSTLLETVQFTAGTTSPSSSEKNKKINRCKNVRQTMIKSIKTMVTIWSIVSIIGIMIADIIRMSTWIMHNQDLRGWDHFMCMGCILFSSSNFKTMVPLLVGYMLRYRAGSGDMTDLDTDSFRWVLNRVVMVYLIIIFPWLFSNQ